MQIKPSKILDGYSLVMVYPDDKEYALLQPLFKIYGLAVTDTQSDIVYVDGGTFDEQNLDNDHLDAIDAHEMAHIILGHGIKDPNPTEEMEADYFAILLLKAFGYDGGAEILIDVFQDRHNMLYGEAEKVIHPEVYNNIFAFMAKYFPNVDMMNEAYRITREFFTLLATKKIQAGKQKLMEGRLDDAWKVAQKNNVSEELFNFIQTESKAINEQHKYLMWILNQVIQNNIFDDQKIQTDILEPLQYFNKHITQFAKKDINSYRDLTDFIKAVNDVKGRERRTFHERNPGEKVYEDHRIQIFCPTTHEASCYYGAGTKWCTSSNKDSSFYIRYKKKGELYYVLDKTKTTDDNTYKLAIRFVFRQNGAGYEIAEMRNATNDSILSLTEFLSYVGQDAYNAIINDFEKRREFDILVHSFDKLKARYEVAPKEVLEKTTFEQMLEFGRHVGIISTPMELCDLLLQNGIHPLIKFDVDYVAYLGYLKMRNANINQAIVQFVDEYTEIRNAPNFVGLTVRTQFDTNLFSLENVVLYFQTKYPDQWGTMLVTTVLAWYEMGRRQTIAIHSTLTDYLDKFGNSSAFHQLWEEWHGLAGLLKYIKENAPSYWAKITQMEPQQNTTLLKIVQFASRYQNILEIYNALKNTMPEDFSIFDFLWSESDWVEGFAQIYGMEEGIKKLVPFLIKNGVIPFEYLGISALNKYYGSMHETIEAAIEYYTNEDNLDGLLKFLGKKIPLRDQLTYFESRPTEDETDAVMSIIKLYGSDFFNYWTIDDLMSESGQDLYILKQMFADADLLDEFEENANVLMMYQGYMSLIRRPDVSNEQKLMYRQQAFNVADMQDVRYNADDGTVDLILKNTDIGYDAFVDWFYDGDMGYDQGNPRYVAEQLFGGDGLWEPYFDLIDDWKEDVWGATTDEIIQHIRNYIKEQLLPVDIYPSEIGGWDEDDYMDELHEGGYFVLTPERLDQLSDDELGDIINEHADFEDLKREMGWAYEEAYNSALRDEWYDTYTNAILQTLQGGEPKWEKTGKIRTHRYKSGNETKEYTSEEHIFVIPNISFFSDVEEWVDNNIEYETEFQYTSFIETVADNLKTSNRELRPYLSGWPVSKKVAEYYYDAIYHRI